MTVVQIIEAIERLSDDDKLAVVDATARMLGQTDSIVEVASLYRVDEETEKAVEGSAQKRSRLSGGSAADTNVREYYLAQGRRKMAALAAELSARPDPPPEKMLPRGLFQGVVIDEEDFKAAEWHPTDKELIGE